MGWSFSLTEVRKGPAIPPGSYQKQVSSAPGQGDCVEAQDPTPWWDKNWQIAPGHFDVERVATISGTCDMFYEFFDFYQKYSKFYLSDT